MSFPMADGDVFTVFDGRCAQSRRVIRADQKFVTYSRGGNRNTTILRRSFRRWVAKSRARQTHSTFLIKYQESMNGLLRNG